MPTLPAYRNDFFALLKKELGNEYKFTVAYGKKAGMVKNLPTENSVFFDSIGFNGYLINLLGYRIIWIKRLLKYVFYFKPDLTIILFNSGILNLLIIQLYFIISGRKYLLWSCGHKRAEISGGQIAFKNLINDFFNKRASGHISYGGYYADELVRQGIPRQKVFVAQNTLNVERILLTERNVKAEVRNRLELPKTFNIFIYVGAIIPSKNLLQAIKIFMEILQENRNIIFIIIGEGTEKEVLNKFINDKNLVQNIHLLPSMYGVALAEYFFSADAFLLPGTGGLAVNEAMAYGLPIISTKGDGTIYDLLVEKENGFFINDDLSNMKEKIRMFLNLTDSAKLSMGEKSKKILIEKATLHNMVNQFATAIAGFI